MKLESLKDRPATKEHIGKTVYFTRFCKNHIILLKRKITKVEKVEGGKISRGVCDSCSKDSAGLCNKGPQLKCDKHFPK